ncbi:glycosyltransferase family 4 protein [Photobacterium sp. BZF1]|uniref:glycosyltransferase family 4 protein n=1 Tax=Photobacterium sp. BZF1 TaxID=1904457 RepID=UPI0016539BD1|nr:glycosyltransferase family 4 protein [Photobacterium sp. BZF1]MBC7006271.1 glycosyltransferase family 4 protein [Photobacterium sp. BZF1]
MGNFKESNIHIVFLINDICALGGTERMCTLIANQLQDIGFKISIVSHHESNSTPFFYLNPKVNRSELFKVSKSRIHHLLLPFFISKRIKQINPDLVISCDTQMCLYSSLPLFRRNHIAWEHFNSEIVTKFGSRWFGRRLASLLCKKIIVLTKSDKDNWIQSLQTPPEKVEVIPNPLPISPLENWDEIEREKIVLAVGRMTDQKGFDLLIEAWNQIPADSRSNWTLRIVGPNGSAKSKLENQINQYELKECVELISESADISQEYKKASMYILSSRYEGFGLTLIEAMGQGLPVIAFNCPMGPSEIIEDKYGKLLPPGDINKMAESITAFLESPKLRSNYGKLAYQRSKAYSSSNIIERWKLLLCQV